MIRAAALLLVLIPPIGVELEERYCEIAARRLSQDTLLANWDRQ